MKEFFNKITKWLKISNRDKHLKYGSLCTLIVIVFSTIILLLPISLYTMASLFTLMVIGALAVGMEFKDKMWGGEFDWLDLLATIILPILLTLITLI